jgi:chitin disaccharide deacetylase
MRIDQDTPSRSGESACGVSEPPCAGLLMVNADDWGQDRETTERTLECVLGGAVGSVSGMVFMEDSERAASMAHERGLDVGLHLNLTTPFSAPGCPNRLSEHQQRLSGYLRRHRFAPVVLHPGLTRSFKYVVTAQIDEFARLYGSEPARIDGHHHMHLCANVMLQNLLPSGTVVRRNFSFQTGEKGFSNRMYRRLVDRALSRRHRLPDFLFALKPIEPRNRLLRIFSLARKFQVEVETHPINPEEYRFLTSGEIFRWAENVKFGSSRQLSHVGPGSLTV